MKNKNVVEELIYLLNKGNAHAPLDAALENIPYEKITEQPDDLPYTLWSLVEHVRIAQWDILQFCKNSDHKSPEWPEGYWTQNKNPSKQEWQNCLNQIKSDRKEFLELISESSDKLMEPIPHSDGQSLFREALMLADHNSYHTGEIIVLRRVLRLWE